MDDWNELKAYVDRGDENAFAAVVRRYLGLVYSAALRRLGDRSASEEVTQQVFILLARKASKLKPVGSLGAWLYRTACLKSKDYHRNETTRRRREEQARTMEETNHDQETVNWAEIAPVLEEAMESLGEQDRAAVLMRYFEGRRLGEIALTLELSEEATRKRVSRALDRLRGWFEKRGVACSSSALGVALSASAIAAAPEALATSTVQSALALGGTSTTTILTTMASIKIPLVVTCLASAAIPISLGYLQQPLLKPEVAMLLIEEQAVELALPSPEVSALMAQWQQLRAEYGPDAGSMPRLYEAISGMKDDFRRRAFRTALLAEWAAIAPEEAVSFFASKSEDGRTEDILRVWLKNDSSAAIAHMKENKEPLSKAIGDLLEEIAESDPSSLGAFAPLVKSKNLWDTRVQDAFAEAAYRDLDGMRASAEGLSGSARGEALSGVALAWAEKDGNAALEWAQALEPSEDRGRALQGLLIGWAKSDAKAALDHLEIAPKGGGQSFSINTETAEHVLKAAAEADFDATMEWLGENQDKVTGHGYLGLTKAVGERLLDDLPETLAMLRDHPADDLMAEVFSSVILNEGKGKKTEIWEWLEEQPDSEFTQGLRANVLRAAARHDVGSAMDMATNLIESDRPLGMEDWRFANALVGTSYRFHHVEGLLERAPEELRHALLVAGFNAFPDESIDFDLWRDRLTEISPEHQGHTVRSLAKVQASSDPVGTQAWADTLLGEQRTQAYEGIAKSWASSDSFGASQWVAELPEGEARDHAALALVESVAQSEPDSAWEWAKTIHSLEPRREAMTKALKGLGPSATQVLENDNALDPSERSQLLKTLDTK